ncbi:hypothetical protein AVEN_194345-1, partial [Araneus ventricosus]
DLWINGGHGPSVAQVAHWIRWSWNQVAVDSNSVAATYAL